MNSLNKNHKDILRRGAFSGIFAPALTRKAELQAAALYAWAAVHGLTMLAMDRLATLEYVSSEGIAQKMMTTISRGLVEKKKSANGSTI